MLVRNEVRFMLLACLIASLVCLLSPGEASAAVPAKPARSVAAAPEKFDATRFVPESELHSGQYGYALTVFHGQKIQRFGVEILGVLKKVNNGKDLILIRVTSGPSVTRRANIAHGMSGSPVYLGKRMVGAIAYSLPFAKEPIGLVTPIGDMLDAWDPDLPNTPSIAQVPGAFGMPSSAGLAVDNSMLASYLDPSVAPGQMTRAEGATQFEALDTPLMVSGMSPRSISRLSSTLAPLGLLPMAGSGAGSSRHATARDEASLVPGAAVGVSIVQGDIDMTAIGTLTYRDGNRVIAFGHPFTGIGPIDAAMTTATITDLFPSVQDSIKLGAPDVTVGRIFQDRPFSVGGIIGSMPKMIPVTVSINDESDKRQRVFHANVINHPLLTGRLVLSVVDEAILETHGAPGDAVAQVKMDVDAEQIGHVVRSNVFYDPLSIADTSISDLQNLLGLLSANPFYPIGIKDVKFDVTIQSRHNTAQIDHIYVPKLRYQPGDTVDVGVVIKLYKQDPVLRKVTLTIPPSTPNGPVTLVVRGGTPTAEDVIGIRPAASVATAANINQMVRKFLEQPKNNEIVASLLLPTTALNVQGEKLSLLPPNFSAIMRSQHSTGLKLERDEVKVVQQLPWVLSGVQMLTINVARKNPLDTPQPATPASSLPPSAQATTMIAPDASDEAPADFASAPDAPALSPAAAEAKASDLPPAPPLNPDAPASADVSTPDKSADASAPANAAGDGQDNDSADGSGDDNAPKVMPVSRMADTWREDTSEEFSSGTLDNVALTSGNKLRLAASPSFYAASTATYIWSMATNAAGDVFAGTGDDGVIYKAAANGEMTPYFRTGELEVTSLAIDRKTGDMYAGTAPHGILFRITPDGKGAKVFTADEKYITALAIDSGQGKLYIATGGGSGRVYAAPLSNVGAAAPFWTSQSSHILALAVDSKGTVYASGAPEGIIYAISPAGKASILYSTADQNVIDGLATGKNDVLYAGSAPKGELIKITPSDSGAPDVLHLLQKPIAPIYAVSADRDGNIWAAAGNTLYSVGADDTVMSHTAATDVQFIALALSDAGGVFAGTSDIGQIYSLGSLARSAAAVDTGTFTSPVHDTKLPSDWGAITWDADSPPATSISLQTRTGDVPHPDESWSDWSTPYTNPAFSQITSPAARYIQYRVVFTGRAAGAQSRASLSAVTVYFLTQNQPPTVKMRDPMGGDDIYGDYTVRWAGSDPDHDTLSYDLYYSTDQKNWVLVKPAVRSAAPKSASAPAAGAATPPGPAAPAPAPEKSPRAAPPAPPAPPGASSPTAKPAAVDVARPAIVSEDTHVVVVAAPHPGAGAAAAAGQSPGQTQPATSQAGQAPDAHEMSTSQVWSTAKLPDGRYYLKVVASDLPSNATGSLTAESVSGPVVVDNTSPAVRFTGAATVDSKRQATVTGTTTGKISFIVAVQYKIDDQDAWSAAAPQQHLLDSAQEAFTLTTPPLTPGAHKITVEAINEADNTGVATLTVNVPDRP